MNRSSVSKIIDSICELSGEEKYQLQRCMKCVYTPSNCGCFDEDELECDGFEDFDALTQEG